MWAHWRKYTAERDIWYALLRCRLVPKAPAETRLMKVGIVSYRVRLLDLTNLWAGAKPVPDGLKRLGYLVDDSPKWCDLTVTQQKCIKAEERTVITMEPA